VQFINNSINNAATVVNAKGSSVTLLEALSSRNGGEVIDASSY
jgi:hypothetical protein